jgi:hypothetical protein
MKSFLLSILLIVLSYSFASAQAIQCELLVGNHKAKAMRDGFILRSYRFTFKTQIYTAVFSVNIESLNNLAQYDQYSRLNIALMTRIATQELAETSSAVLNVAQQQGFNKSEKAAFALALVQALPYATDEESLGQGEFYRLPSETITDTNIDCEDSCILLAGILSGLGIPYVYLSPPGHIAVGVEGAHRGWHANIGGRKFYYAETTGAGFLVGQAPTGTSRNIYLLDVSGDDPNYYSLRLEKDGKPIRYKASGSESNDRRDKRKARSGASIGDTSVIIWPTLLIVVVIGLFIIGGVISHYRQTLYSASVDEEDDNWISSTDEEDFENDRAKDNLEI